MALPKMYGTTEEPIQVDESYFSGRRNNNRGRPKARDEKEPSETAARQELEIELPEWDLTTPATTRVMSLAVRQPGGTTLQSSCRSVGRRDLQKQA